MTYEELRAICEAPKEQRAEAIKHFTCEIEAVIAAGPMGWQDCGNYWLTGLGAVCFSMQYDPLRKANQALAAVDQMIARGWYFEPKLAGLDFSAVDGYNHERKLHVRVLHWSNQPERHATALSLAVAQAWLLEKKLEEAECQPKL